MSLIVNDGLGLGRIALAGIGAGMKRISIHQVIGQGQVAGIVQILLACRDVGLQGIDNLYLALIESLFARFLQSKINQHFIGAACRTFESERDAIPRDP